MSQPDITPEDTAAMRAVPGDWREYLRSEMDRGAARRQKPRTRGQAPAPPGRRPGGWPPGTRPPDPPPPIPDHEIARAVAEYRANPDEDRTCECQPCRTLQGGTR